MKKKLLLTALVLGALLPFKVHALSGSVNLNCEKDKIAPGESMTCTITGTIPEEVSTVSAKIKVGSNLTLVSVTTDPSWQGDGDGGNIDLYTDTNKIGSFPIASFVVKASDVRGVTTNILLTDVTLSDADFAETTYTVAPVEIRIPSIVNTLSNITIDDKSIANFTADKTSYTLDVNANLSSVKIGATATDSASKITGDIGDKKLVYGQNKFTIKVTSETGEQKAYTITINRPEARNLNQLIINDKAIELKDSIYEYQMTVENSVTTLEIDCTLVNADIVSFVNGFGPREVTDLKVGNNTVFIKIVDQDNQELVYEINVERLVGEEEPNPDKEDSNPVENPNTGIISTCVIGIVVAILAIAGLTFMKKKNYFKQV